MHAIKRLKNKTITILLSSVIAVSLLFGSFAFVRTAAKAESIEYMNDFTPTSLGLSNMHFDSTSGSGYPSSPGSWTGAALDGGKGEVISGVVDLTPSVYSGSNSGNKKFKLDQYDEFKDEKNIPKTIFGESTSYGGSSEKALLINTPLGSSVAYGYKSGDMSFAPNSFYRISVWVRTGNFAANTGATVKLTGLGQNCAFNNINTIKDKYNEQNELTLTENNNYGWIKYRFYVRTSSSLTKTVQLVLGIGDAVSGNDEDPEIMPNTAHGYAFFDTVAAERISAHDFATETTPISVATSKENVYTNADNTAIALNLCETRSFETESGKEIGTFSQNTDEWKTNVYYDENEKDLSYVGMAHSFLYNSQSWIPDLEDKEANTYGFTTNPWAPYGRAEHDGISPDNKFFDGINVPNIMLISTYDGKQFTEAAYGIASPTVKIQRYKYYRFSVWVKGDSVNGGAGISVLLKGKRAGSDKVSTLQTYTGLTGDAEDKAHYGWKEQVIYVRGSMLCDYDARFELWLGSPDSRSSGIAMFDNVTFTELKYSDYSEMSGADGGSVYTLDETENDTNVGNGNFSVVGDMNEIKFPMTVAEWSLVAPEGANIESAVHGIIPTDKKTLDEITTNGSIPGVTVPSDINTSSILLISSNEKQAAFGYQSPALTLATDKANKLTVQLAVNRIDGYGASLVLKTSSGSVISTIENITDTNGTYKTFTFYLAAPLSDQTVNVEVWLGREGANEHSHKLSAGNVFVKRVALDEWTAADESKTVAQEYAEILARYKTDVAGKYTLKSLDYSVYSFSELSIDYYNAYDYIANSESFGTLYQWRKTAADTNTSLGGMFNADYMKNLTVYEGFKTNGLKGNMLFINNSAKNRTVYTYDNTLSLAASKYYRVDIPVKVRVADDVRKDKTSVGATLKLTGTSAVFENIKDTTTLVDKNNEDSRDYETFKTYSFYVSTGDNGGSVGLEISFGGDDYDSYILGKLVIGGVTMTEIDNLEFETAEKDKNNKQQIAVKLSETSDSDDNNSNTEAAASEIQWWVIPTVIFSAALLAAVIIIVVIRVRDRIKSKKKVVYSSEYDRSDVIKDIERLQAQKDSDAAEANADNEGFDYDDEPSRPETDTAEELVSDGSESSDSAEKEESSENNPADELDD